MADFTTDVAIIGAGPSGLFMVFEAGFLGYRAVVLDSLPQVGGQLAALYPEKPIYDVPGHPHILAGDLVAKLQQQAAPYQPTYLLHEAVTDLYALPDDAGFLLTRAGGQTVQARVVVVAGGGGLFAPRKPAGLANLAAYEATGSVAYAITNKAKFADQTIVLAGGGDSAVDWAVELASHPTHAAAHVHVVHRRAEFRAAEATVAQMLALADQGKITLHTPYELKELHGPNGHLERLTLADPNGVTRAVEASALVCCFGLQPQAGALESWNLGLERGIIPVDRTTMQTRRPGLLCIGDMAGYEGKVPLILTGFAEAAVAAKTCQAILNPEKKFKVQYSTSKGVPNVAAPAGA
ncbi:MAG: NAD(P)/FAD-dependent oxidoreductase [Alphaproteobacteria bacterium]|jgi:thioredoxin reductase (NADPH)|nr:NAD(P)/FAD-dependent oxidoreductase [Alphaproteobacteria bacterium]